MTSYDASIRRWLSPLLVGVLPAALLCVGMVHLILNHFFAHGPYLLDAGWYSDVIYRAGVVPENPPIACDYAHWYYGVHFAPILSVFSILSYAVPIHRIEWYAVFEALVALPFGLAPYLLAARFAPACAWRRLPVTVVAALAFAFSGLVIRTIAYPHYEPAIAGVICLLLVALATGRIRLAWALLALSVTVREDAGVHSALALAPLLYLSWRGVAIAATTRTVVRMIAVAIAVSVVEIACQKLVFHGPNVMAIVYTGDPLYSHISGAVLAERAENFVGACRVLYFPFLATCVVAAVWRDPRYLLGWAAGIPWFALNFFAVQPQKATLEAYAGFPFIVSMFWIYLYGAFLAPRRIRPGVLEAAFAGVCVTSTLGLYLDGARYVRTVALDMATTRPMDRAQVHGFVDALAEHRADIGRLYVDYTVAAIALESVTADNNWTPGVKHADAIAFHNETGSRDQLLPDLFANELDICTHLKRTGILVCARDKLAVSDLDVESYPAIFAFTPNLHRPGIRLDDRGVELSWPGAGLDGRLGKLAKGTYELTLALDPTPPPPGVTMEATSLEIRSRDSVRAATTLPFGARTLAITFDASGDEALSFRFRSGHPGRLLVTHARVRREVAR